MAKNHSFINTTRCTCWDVDAYNACGVAQSDMDNGQFVSLGAIQLNADVPGGYEFAVTAPAANATNLWVIDTPEVGIGADNIYDDPRYFYNVAGRPMSLRYMNPIVDYIEVPASAFSTAPVDGTSKFASVGTDGRFVAAAVAPAQGTYFAITGTHTIDIGLEAVKTYILQCVRN
nr:MAG TPA: hypothetical protein [Caudoviricetes sp.]